MLSLIDRYVSKLFFGYFLAGLIVFTSIFLAADFTSSIVRFDVGTDVFIRYYTNYLPNIVYQMIPVACLVATMFTITSMNKNNELVALYSMGMSLARICMPILVIVGCISVTAFWVGDKVLPHAMRNRNYIYFVEMKKRPNLFSTVKQNKIWYRSKNVIFNIGVFNQEASRAQELTMYYFDEAWRLVQLIRAKEVEINKNIWNMKDGAVTLFTEESSFPLTRTFQDKTVSMSEDLSEITTINPASDAISVSDLRRYIEKNKSIGLDTQGFEVDYHGKYSFAFSGFVLALLGLPFATKSQRSGGAMMNIAVVAALALVYWILFSAGLAVGKQGAVPPLVAAWTPNLVVLSFAVVLLRRNRTT